MTRGDFEDILYLRRKILDLQGKIKGATPIKGVDLARLKGRRVNGCKSRKAFPEGAGKADEIAGRERDLAVRWESELKILLEKYLDVYTSAEMYIGTLQSYEEVYILTELYLNGCTREDLAARMNYDVSTVYRKINNIFKQ